MDKIYTAQEMRETADFFVRNAEMVRRKVWSNAILANIHESISMLRHAADIMECKSKRENKKYEYATTMSDGSPSQTHYSSHIFGYHTFRREVGEWEEAK